MMMMTMAPASQNCSVSKLDNMDNLAQWMALSSFFIALMTFLYFSPSTTLEVRRNVQFQMYKTTKALFSPLQ